ncbi:response regulator transcription factor [Ammoniphilus resinae]|uniref:DNA-binding response OmpR family regulator n=1 Tax=Ammoniphilus resinae TaxID=861532 RepID=A0ABS4GRA4_9BACL|nr:response regulator transcription factor [Ammoniphilus resinae]MBP1932793.1 DNA-binding response OmpR family regulator [Ammoniphilus resinae]
MKQILIIEDDQVIVEVEKDYLSAGGFQVEIATNGDLGLRKALENEFDLIILDLMLPGMDGFEICRQIRLVKNIPILMVSAKKEDIDKIRGLGLGADDYMTKPFSVAELVARVKAHLSRYDRLVQDNRVAPSEDIRLRGIRIEKGSRKVYVNEKETPLTSKEYDLLLFLASHPNRVFTKDELFERIWGLDSLGDIATVTVHISKLREKIETAPAKPQYIETIWGVGYRFNV